MLLYISVYHKFITGASVFRQFSRSMLKFCRAYTAITIKYMSHFHSSRVNAATLRVSGEPSAIVICLPLLGNIFNEQNWNLANIVFMVAKMGNVCFEITICVREAKMFLTSGGSLLLGACNSHNKPIQRHFYRPVCFKIFSRENGQFQST